MDDDLGRCADCGRPLGCSSSKYCSNACRQRAYRRRREAVGHGSSSGRRGDSFVGRQADLRRLAGLLRTERMITVVGVAGAGKSRLVREVFRDEHARGGVPGHYVDLRDGKEPLDAMMGVENGVLFVDNADHRAADCAHRLAYLLDRHPRLKIISASREAWCLPAEVRHQLEGLALPGPDNDVIPPPVLPDSVRLFIERSAAVSAGFTANDDNLTLIRAICVRLAGLPLLIEFAAQLTRSLSLAEIAEVAENAGGDLCLLSGGWSGDESRHRSWRAALQPSHEALGADERLCLRRISVLDGSFAASAAYAVLRDRMSYPEAVAALTRLHDKSLINVAFPASGTVPARFRLLEPVRQFAGEALTAAREEETARVLLTSWAVEEAASVCTPNLPAEEDERRLGPEADKIRTVLADLLARRDPRAARLCAAVPALCQDAEGADAALYGAVVDFAAAIPAQHEYGWAVGIAAARLATLRGDHHAAVCILRGATARAVQRAGAAPATRRLFLELSLTCESADLEGAGLEAVQTCLALSLGAGDQVMAAVCHSRLARHRLEHGDIGEAARLLSRALPALSEHRPAVHLGAALNVLGALGLERGDVPAASQHFKDSLRVVDPRSATAAESMTGLALCAAHTADPRRAVRLLAAGVPDPSASAVTRWWASRIAQARADAQNMLSDGHVRQCHRVGTDMRRPQAVAYAMHASAIRAHAAEEDAPNAEQLSRREWQIVAMVSRGLTNREIATRLFLSVRTIEAHVRAVRRKVGLRSRTQIATWAVLRDPPFPDSASWSL